MRKEKLLVLDSSFLSLFEQLQIEEAFLRLEDKNLLLINRSPLEKALILGRAGEKELVNEKLHKKNPVSIIRRFSGGGAIVADENTFFISFIMNASSLPITPYPETIANYFGDFYKKAFSIEGFSLRENDYVIHDKKCGGNAQFIQKDRWVHHTSFLYKYDPKLMRYLSLPKKMPSYREKRPHEQFVTALHPFFPEKELFFQRIIQEIENRFSLVPISLDAASSLRDTPHRKVTELITL